MAMAQKVDYNAIIVPNLASQIEFEEKLVRLAWNNDPESEAIRRSVKLAEQELRAAALEPLRPGDWPDTLVARVTMATG